MKLQVARQSKSTANKRSNRYSSQQTPQSDFAEDNFSQESENLVEEEWYEAGSLEEFDSDGGMEDDWDVDETELEQSLALIDTGNSSTNTTIGRGAQMKFPPSNFSTAGKPDQVHSLNATARNDFQSANMLCSMEPRKRSMSGADTAPTSMTSTERQTLARSCFSPPRSNDDRRNTGKSSLKSDHQNTG